LPTQQEFETDRLPLRNFAGILGSLTMSWDTPVEEYTKVINVNLIGVWICTKLQLKQMIKQDSIAV
jgi:NAD(P)-dependent dehydrogenase (short-subunit alcohol dehydrogenase family)